MRLPITQVLLLLFNSFFFYMTVRFIVLFFCLLCYQASAHVIGIDFGSSHAKVAGVRGDRGMDIILNEMSQRSTDNYIGFHRGERYFGTGAKSLAARFPTQVASSVNRLLSDPFSSDRAGFRALDLEFSVEESHRGLLVQLPDSNGPFSSEELYSMMLSYFAKISLDEGVVDPSSITVTIPGNSSFYYRQAVITGAKLAGVKVLGLVEATTAAAYYYGMKHRGFGNRTVTIAIVDVGYSHAEVGVFQFTPPLPNAKRSAQLGTLTKLSVANSFLIGGRFLDLCIADDIRREARVCEQCARATDYKAHFSLLRAARTIRERLSVNMKTPYTVEGIESDKDFSSSYSRNDFENKCLGILTSVLGLVEKAVSEAGTSFSQLHSIELIGGVSRTPQLILELNKLLKREVSRTLNMDEAPALGAGYLAANLSPFYQAKSFALRETLNQAVFFAVTPFHSSSPARRVLFSPVSVLGESMSVTLQRSDDFTVQLFAELQDTPFAEISVYNVESVLKSISSFDLDHRSTNNTHMIRMQVKLMETGVFEVEAVEAIVKHTVSISSKEVRNVTDESGTVKEEVVVVAHPRVRVSKVVVPFSIRWIHPKSLTSEDFEKSVDKLSSISLHETEKRLRSHAKNDLEEYIFWAKGSGVVESEVMASKIGENAIQVFSSRLLEAQRWLEEEEGSEDSCTRQQYEAKVKELKDFLNELKVKSEKTISREDDGDL